MKNIDSFTERFKFAHERFLTGCDSLEELDAWDYENYGEMDVFYSNELMSVILRLIAADGVITQTEADYLNRNFGFEYTCDELGDIYENCREEITGSLDENFRTSYDMLEAINEKLADLYKEMLALICDIIIESDGDIARAEIEEATKLRALCS